MSIFGDLKRIFFGAKSVAKHQGGKAVDAAKDLGEDLVDKAGDLAEKGKDALSGLGDKIQSGAETAYEKGSDATEKAGDWLNDRWSELNTSDETSQAEQQNLNINLDEEELVPDPAAPTSTPPLDFEEGLEPDPHAPKDPSSFQKAADATLDKAAKAGVEVKEAAERLGEKIGDISEKVGGKVLEKGDELLSKAAEAGAGMKEKFDELVDRASAAAEQESMDETIAQAEEAAAQAEAKAKAFDGQEAERDTSESTLTGSDSFFDRAARYAEGDYHDEGGKEVKLQQDPEYKAPEKGGDILGFGDADGDGDALIDDAEIEEEGD